MAEQRVRPLCVCLRRPPSKIKHCAPSVVTTRWRCGYEAKYTHQTRSSAPRSPWTEQSAECCSVNCANRRPGLITWRRVVWRWINLYVLICVQQGRGGGTLAKGNWQWRFLDLWMHFDIVAEAWEKKNRRGDRTQSPSDFKLNPNQVSCREAPPFCF